MYANYSKLNKLITDLIYYEIIYLIMIYNDIFK